MSYMFSRCNSLTNIDLSNFNTQNVTNMSYMFYGFNFLISQLINSIIEGENDYEDGENSSDEENNYEVD